MKTHQSNTYDLILASEAEDKKRNAVETLIYSLFILSAVFSIFQFAAQPVVVPGKVAVKQVTTQIEKAG